MTEDTETDLEQILVSDDEFAPEETAKPTLKPLYYRNKLSSKGGLLSSEERKIAEGIFDPNDDDFLEAIKDAF